MKGLLLNTFRAYVTLIIGLGFHEPLFSQIDGSTLIHLDKPYYVTGETVYYKMYFPGELREKGPMLEIQIYNGEGNLIDRSYLKKGSENHVNGYYKIPFEFESGVYTLMASSLVEINQQTVRLGRIPLAIYNDSDSPFPSSNWGVGQGQQSEFRASQLKVSIKLQQLTIRPRGRVNLIVEVKDTQGNIVEADISLAVTDKGLIGKEDSYPFSTIGTSQVSLDPTSFLSEYIPVTGQLENHQEDQLMTFFMPSSNRIYYTTSEADGNFQLLIPAFHGQQSMQYIGAFSDGAKMELEKNGTIERSGELVYPESVLSYLKVSRDRKLIYQLYNKVEGAHTYETPNIVEMTAPDRIFKATDYPFESIPSFCKELSTPLKFLKERKGAFEFKMFNPESRNFYFGTPLFIIDGQMTKDVKYLSTLDFQSIDEISLYYDNQRLSHNFGFAGFSGVVIISSKEGKAGVPIDPSTQVFQLNGLQSNIVDLQEDWTVEEPVLKPQLVWEPALSTNSRGHLEYSYQQSDDISQFQIEVVVQSEDGRRGFGRLEYRVTD